MKYYIYIYSQKEGPFSLEELSNKNLKADTLVWREGLTEWKQAKEFPELHSFIYATPPDPTVTNTPPTPMPKTWFVESILVTIFCCIPFGIIGIIKSNEVEPLWIAGHHEQALIKANEAKKWVMWGFFSMLIFIVLYILFWVCIGVMAAAL